MGTMKEFPISLFESVSAFEQWLSNHHTDVDGLWIKISKKASGFASVTYEEALEVALCYGWIDGQRKRFDELFFLQRFTPRRAKSLWSKRNVSKIETLIEAGKVQPAGLLEVEAAKKDGRWEAAYDSAKDMIFPEDFLSMLAKNEAAQAFFGTLNRADLYAIAWRLQTAKSLETRQKRFDSLLTRLERAKKFH
jgi:uncharacterized protein YdeI (YjbR/CyaY-like superfamily)